MTRAITPKLGEGVRVRGGHAHRRCESRGHAIACPRPAVQIGVRELESLSGKVVEFGGYCTCHRNSDRGINIQAISTSEIKVSVLIDEDETELAVRVLHTAYDMDAEGEAA